MNAFVLMAVASAFVPQDKPYPASDEMVVEESPLFSVVVSGGNRLVNSSFELGSCGYALVVNTSYEKFEGKIPTLEVVSDVAKEGGKSLRLDTRGFKGHCVFNTHACYGIPGQKLTFSCWIKADRSLPCIPCSFGDSASMQNGANDWFDAHGNLSADTEWRRVSMVSPRALDDVHLRAVFKLNLVCDAVVWIDGAKVEVGDKATDYSPMFTREGVLLGNEPVLVQKPGERAEGRAELRVADYTTGQVTKSLRSYGSASYGTFKLTEKVGDNWALPYLYAVVHPLGKSNLKTRADSPGFIVGCNHTELRTALSGQAAALVTDSGTLYSRELTPYVRLAGNGMVRIMGAGLQWIDLEPERGVFRWSRLDGAVESAIAAGLEPMLCPGGSAFMAWVDPAKDGKRRNWYVRKNSREARKHGFYNAEKNTGAKSRVPAREDWEEHLNGILAHYAGRVTWYELINEPNLQLADPSDYFEILKDGAKTIRAFSPKNKVIGICATGDFGGDIGPYVDALGKLGVFDLVDIMSFHPYDAPTDVTGVGADRQIEMIGGLRDKYRSGLPIIEDECYFLCDQGVNRGYSWRVANWSSGDLVRRLAIDLAGGLLGSMPLSVGEYQAGDACHPYFAEASGFNFGFTPSRRFVAQNFFAYLLEGARNGGRPDLPKGLNGTHAIAKDGRSVTIVWAKRSADETTMECPKNVVAFDRFGNRLHAEPLGITTQPVYLVSTEKAVDGMSN